MSKDINFAKELINKKPAIKVSANMRYTTDSNSSSIYAQICFNANVYVLKIPQ